MRTKAAVLCKIGEPLEVTELTIPDLKPHQVLVDIAYSGICGSQILEIEGGRGLDPYLPHTFGHEGSGMVAEVGIDVKKVKPGDHVVLSWIRGLGVHTTSCAYDSGKVHSGAISTFMTRAVVSETCVTRISNKIPLKEAALLGCAFATGFGAVQRTAEVETGSSIAIFGLGGVGLSAVIAAVMARAKPIVATDTNIGRLRKAADLGATFAIRAGNGLWEIAHGVDYAIEATGNSKAMEAAFRVTRDGGLCVLAGNLPHGQHISIDPFDLIKGKRVVGTWGGDTFPDRDIIHFVDLYLDGTIALNKLIGTEYPLDKINEALTSSRTDAGRTLIKMES